MDSVRLSTTASLEAVVEWIRLAKRAGHAGIVFDYAVEGTEAQRARQRVALEAILEAAASKAGGVAQLRSPILLRTADYGAGRMEGQYARTLELLRA